MCSIPTLNWFQVHENLICRYCTTKTRLVGADHKWHHLRQEAQTSIKLNPGQSNPRETRSIDPTTPELGPVGVWSPKSSTFSGSDSIVVRRNFLSRRPSINKSERSDLLLPES